MKGFKELRSKYFVVFLFFSFFLKNHQNVTQELRSLNYKMVILASFFFVKRRNFFGLCWGIFLFFLSLFVYIYNCWDPILFLLSNHKIHKPVGHQGIKIQLV